MSRCGGAAEISVCLAIGATHALPRRAVRIFSPGWEVPLGLGVGAAERVAEIRWQVVPG